MAQDKHWTQAARDALASAEEAVEKTVDPGARAQAYAAIALGHLLTGLDQTLTSLKGEVAQLVATVDTIQGDTERIAGK